MGADLQEERGPLPDFGRVGQDADAAVGMEAVQDAGAGADRHSQLLVADGHAPVGADFEGGAHAPDAEPPGAARGRAQHAAFFALGRARGGIGRARQFALDLMGRCGGGASRAGARWPCSVKAAGRK